MSAYDADALYALLPAFVRLRDQTEGDGSLRALIEVIAAQAAVVSAGLDRLYDDQFIETCAPWVVPYIGDLIGYRPLRPLGDAGIPRSEVADTIGFRRRKGTVAMLEQLAEDITGWPAHAVEYFSRLAITQYVRSHLRPQNAVIDIRSPVTALEIGGAFDLPPRAVDVRRIASGRGRYNIPNIGIFVWRLHSYGPPLASAAFPEGAAGARRLGAGRYTFDPFGGDVPLVNPVPPARQDFSLSTEHDLPIPLRRYPMYAARRAGAPEPDRAPFTINLDGAPLAWSAIEVCDLSGWAVPTDPGVLVAVDPELGRVVFATAPEPATPVAVGYTYAFSGDYGGGTYAQAAAPGEPGVATGTAVSFAGDDPGTTLPTITSGAVEVTDSGLYDAGDVTVAAAAGAALVIRANDHQRPVIARNVTVEAPAGATVTLRGIGVGGKLTVAGAGPFTLQLEHCTVRGGIEWPAPADVKSGRLLLDHTVCGAVTVNPEVTVEIADSIVDAGATTDDLPAVSAPAGANAGSVTIARSTVLGTVAARTIPLLENSIVTGLVTAAQRQTGCVRYSYVPVAGSVTPRRFRCQPDLAIAAATDAAQAADPGLNAAQRAVVSAGVQAWLRPVFSSRAAGKPGYAQLSDAGPEEIRAGAAEGDEMGAFYGLWNTRRQKNLSFRCSEYLRVGLEVGVIHAT